MVKIIRTERVGKNGKLAVGCSAAIFSGNNAILLIRRTDDGKWAVPGGYMEPGEDFSEACTREVFEETGLSVEISRLISVYTNPHLLLEYPDGNRWQLIILHFEATIVTGEIRKSNESSDIRFFKLEEIAGLEMSVLDHLRVLDAFSNCENTIVQNRFDL